MNKIRIVLRNGFIASLIMLLVGAMPVPAFAQESTHETTNTTTTEQTAEQPQSAPVEKPSTGTTGPTGAASWTYWYNEGTGLWENDYYTYNPSTRETVPKTPHEYTYNASTGMWDTEVWQYSASAGAYRKVTVSVTAPPTGAITHGGQAALPSTPNTPEPAAQTPSSNPPSTAQPSTAQNAQSSSGSPTPNSNTGSGKTYANGGSLTFSNSGTITNYLDATAQTGDAIVIANTTAGNASSGDATSMANIVNLLQSQSAFGAPGMATFTANIQGNVQGDFLIDPAKFVQPAGQPSNDLTNLEVNSKNEGTINNDITLNAQSGNAAADKNTAVGNVTSGDASAIANVVNMINSVVAANQSFMGVVNIHGDYTGNILMPTDSLNALLASSGSQPESPATTTVNNTSTQSIHNDIDFAASSGNATSSQNTSSGNVTSGNGLTNLTLLNLTGRKVVAANSLLVFVNVLGSWVGLIMDAPAGTTSAALGGGVNADTTAALAGNTAINSTENFGINNKITAQASSGDASAKQNTSVGDVTSGDATASANVANIVNSQFSMSNWFGVLFINVFGTWRGNFGVAKPPLVQPITSGAAGPVSGAASVGAKDMRIFAFVPKTSAAPSGESAQENLQLSPLSEAQQTGNVQSDELVDRVSKVLSSNTGKSVAAGQTANTTAPAEINWSGLMLALGIVGFGAVGIDRVRTNLRSRKLGTKI